MIIITLTLILRTDLLPVPTDAIGLLMAYFQELPNILYPSLLPSRNKVESRVTVKNLFKRSKLRTDLDQAITF